jgi:hypothetical protein
VLYVYTECRITTCHLLENGSGHQVIKTFIWIFILRAFLKSCSYCNFNFLSHKLIPKFNWLFVIRKRTRELWITSLFLLSYKRCSKWLPCPRTHNSALPEKEIHKCSKFPDVFCHSIAHNWIRRHSVSLVSTVLA